MHHRNRNRIHMYGASKFAALPSAVCAVALAALLWPSGPASLDSQPGDLFAAPPAAETATAKTTKPKIESGVRRWHNRGATRVALPDGYQLPRAKSKVFDTKAYQLRLYAQEFAQGRAIYVEILPPAGHSGALPEKFQAALVYGKGSVPLSRHSFGYRGFVGIAPYAKIGKTVFKVTAGTAPSIHSGQHAVTIADTKFPVFRRAMNLGTFSNASRPLTKKQLANIKAGRAKKNRAFNLRTPTKIGSRLSHPRDLHKITSPFWARRITKRYKIKNGKRIELKPKQSTHGGLDLRGVTGAPIFAVADATVAVAEPMHYEGKFTMLDHGQGVMSIYMHQSKLSVKAGQKIKAGDEIGHSGATGAVTGAHLHIAVYVRRVPVEPLSFLTLPVRD